MRESIYEGCTPNLQVCTFLESIDLAHTESGPLYRCEIG